MSKDIFISYKNDGEGNNFAARLCGDLEELGYDVYYNPNEQHAGRFPTRLKNAVESCKDFLLILTQPCLDQLMRHDKIDWVREELITAYRNEKNIIPLLMSGVSMPKDKEDMPEELHFLPDTDGISITEPYNKSPLEFLVSWVKSQPTKEDTYRDIINGNISYNVFSDFEQTLEKAKTGSHKAMYEIANMYYYGFADENKSSDRDFSKAYEWFEKLSDTNNEYKAYADSMIGRMYYDGTVPFERQSYEKSFDYHKKSAEILKFGYSAIRVAYMQQEGRGCEYDFDAIEKYYLEFVENGDETIKMNLAEFYMQHGMFQKAAKIFNLMENSVSTAEYNLGVLYKSGVLSNPPKPNYIQASYHFQNAINCDNPNPDAANQLGLMYFAHTGNFRKDFKMAEKYFSLAANMGNASSQYMLGYMYEFGYVKKDIPLAIKYFSMASKQGEIYSNHHLAMLYQQTECKNYHKSFKYAKMSADNSIPEGEFILANLLYMGRGCKADEKKAYEYYKLALEHGMEQAEFMIERIENTSKKN